MATKKKAAPAPVRAEPIKEVSDHDLWTARLKTYKPGGYWRETWGPRPESGRSTAPRKYVRDWQSRQRGGARR